MRIMLSLAAAALAVALSAPAQEWQPLEVPADLAGWRIAGDGGEWTVADGVVTGRAARDINSWLLYEGAEYADFEFEYEFRTPEPTNGGVQFRSHWLPKTPVPAGVNPADAEHLMYGYQANVETRQRTGSGKIIDENGRGPLCEPALSVVQPLIQDNKMSQRGWNTMRIVAMGPKIEVYMGGERVCAVEDEAYIGGFLALQVYHLDIEADVTEVQYRNMRVKDYGRCGTWRPLFNGENLDGWKEWGSEEWAVEDGAIIGRSGPKQSEGYLATEETWTDFRVRGSFQMMGDGNFGLFYHSSITLRDDGYPVIAGVQGEVEPGFPGSTGWVYESYKRGWLVKPDMSQVGAVAMRPGQWSEIEIRSVGSTVDTWVNGIRVLHLEDPAPNLTEGSFALQLHTGGVDGIKWKGIYVLEVDSQ